MPEAQRRAMAMPPTAESQDKFERWHTAAQEAITSGDYNLAAALYELTIAAAIVRQNHDMRIEATFRLADVTHKLGDDEAAAMLVSNALAVREITDSEFDIHQFLHQEN